MDLINRTELLRHIDASIAEGDAQTPIVNAVLTAIKCAVEQMPRADAVPISVIESWLYEIAFNNSSTYFSSACKEIISRLGGLQRYYEDYVEMEKRRERE